MSVAPHRMRSLDVDSPGNSLRRGQRELENKYSRFLAPRTGQVRGDLCHFPEVSSKNEPQRPTGAPLSPAFPFPASLLHWGSCQGLPSEITMCRAPGWLSRLIGPTLDFGSGHDHRVVRLSPASGSVLSKESVCPSPSAPPPAHALT